MHQKRVLLVNQSSPRCLLGNFFSRQGSSFPDGALMLALKELRSVSAILRDTSAAVPTLSCDVLVMVSSPGHSQDGKLLFFFHKK